MNHNKEHHRIQQQRNKELNQSRSLASFLWNCALFILCVTHILWHRRIWFTQRLRRGVICFCFVGLFTYFSVEFFALPFLCVSWSTSVFIIAGWFRIFKSIQILSVLVSLRSRSICKRGWFCKKSNQVFHPLWCISFTIERAIKCLV